MYASSALPFHISPSERPPLSVTEHNVTETTAEKNAIEQEEKILTKRLRSYQTNHVLRTRTSVGVGR